LPRSRAVLWALAVCLWIVALPHSTVAEEDLFAKVGRTYGVNPLILRAIAQVESSFHPYAIGIRRINGRPQAGEIRNVVGQVRVTEGPKTVGVFPRSREQALRLISHLEKGGFSFDVGLCQLSSRTLRDYGLAPSSVLEPQYNLAWAAYHLGRLFARHGYGWEAVWRYNGKRAYSVSVQRAVEGNQLTQVAR